MSFNSNRRDFLRNLSVGGSAAVAAKGFLQIHEAFGQQIQTARKQLQHNDFESLRRHYLLDERVVYLNHASIGTIPRPVHEARVGYLRLCESNPWLYMWGGAWDEARELVRSAAASLMQCQASEIAITHNTTEMFNVLAHGLPWAKGDEVLFSSLCHVGASQPFLQFAAARGYVARRFEFPVDRIPNISAKQVVDVYAEQISPATRLLVIPHIDNTVGLRYPVAALAEMARAKGVEFIAVDGAQSVGMIPVDVSSMGVDVYATSPHKWLQAPKGLGLAYINRRAQDKIKPMWVTWGQKRWAGSARIYEDYGTRNFAELLSLGDAIEFHLGTSTENRVGRLEKLWNLARRLVDRADSISWGSPNDWNLAGSLYAVKLERPGANKVAEKLFAEHQTVVRPFQNAGLNSLRVSPNIFTRENEIRSFINLVEN